MPWEEVASVVDGKCLLDMRGNEIIVSVLAARALRLGRLGGQLRDALDSFDIVILLRCGKGCPKSINLQLMPRLLGAYHSLRTMRFRGLHFLNWSGFWVAW
jgi:hypothetical protein